MNDLVDTYTVNFLSFIKLYTENFVEYRGCEGCLAEHIQIEIILDSPVSCFATLSMTLGNPG
jgi:hypothetical protein